MSGFVASESLLNSNLMRRSQQLIDKEWENGTRKGKRAIKRVYSTRIFKQRKYQTSPDRSQSWKRKRRIGARSISMPHQICELFTEGERASLNIVANVIKENGICNWPLDKIAAIAGVCRRTVQNALSMAKETGLLTVQLRPVKGRKNLPNLIRIVSKQWLKWLRKSSSSFNLAIIGCKTLHPTGDIYSFSGNFDASKATSSSHRVEEKRLVKGKRPDD